MALPVRVLAGVLACAFLLVVPAFAQGAENLTPQLADTPDIAHAKYDGVQHLQYKYGPVADPGRAEQHRDRREPGAEAEGRRLDHPHAAEPRADGRHRPARRRHPPPPRGVAQRDSPRRRRPAAALRPSSPPARRRRSSSCPRATACATSASDKWILNYMIHNLTPRPTKVYITWDIDFVPDSAPGAKGMTEAKPLWMDVRVRRDLPGLRRASRRRHERHLHLPGPGSQRLSGRPPAQHVHGRPRHARCSARPATCIRAACTTTSG